MNEIVTSVWNRQLFSCLGLVLVAMISCTKAQETPKAPPTILGDRLNLPATSKSGNFVYYRFDGRYPDAWPDPLKLPPDTFLIKHPGLHSEGSSAGPVEIYVFGITRGNTLAVRDEFDALSSNFLPGTAHPAPGLTKPTMTKSVPRQASLPSWTFISDVAYADGQMLVKGVPQRVRYDFTVFDDKGLDGWTTFDMEVVVFKK